MLRVGDAAARQGFAVSRWIDRAVTLGRGQGFGRLVGRSLVEWQARLAELGFAVASEPMHAGTPFANVLLVGTVERPPRAAPAA